MGAIGIVGGVGPSAGTDLASKVFRHTKAVKDQDHIDLYLTSCPSIIPDRTGFLLEGGDDPAPGISTCLKKLASCGATVAGIGCNTAHSPQILRNVKIPEGMTFLNMIEETCREVSSLHEGTHRTKIGLLGTLGTIRTGIYKQYFDNYKDLELVVPPGDICEAVHDCIYNKKYGIKALSSVSKKVDGIIRGAVDWLADRGCRAVILGCTELPLVFEGETTFHGAILCDPTDILAKALVRATAPEKLI